MPHRFLELLALGRPGKLRFDGVEKFGVCRHGLGNLRRREQSRLVGIVEIGCVIRHFVRQIDQLRFERRTQARQIFVELGKLARARNRANASRCLRALRRSGSVPGNRG